MTRILVLALFLAACANPEITKPLPPPYGNAVATNAADVGEP